MGHGHIGHGAAAAHVNGHDLKPLSTGARRPLHGHGRGAASPLFGQTPKPPALGLHSLKSSHRNGASSGRNGACASRSRRYAGSNWASTDNETGSSPAQMCGIVQSPQGTQHSKFACQTDSGPFSVHFWRRGEYYIIGPSSTSVPNVPLDYELLRRYYTLTKFWPNTPENCSPWVRRTLLPPWENGVQRPNAEMAIFRSLRKQFLNQNRSHCAQIGLTATQHFKNTIVSVFVFRSHVPHGPGNGPDTGAWEQKLRYSGIPCVLPAAHLHPVA